MVPCFLDQFDSGTRMAKRYELTEHSGRGSRRFYRAKTGIAGARRGTIAYSSMQCCGCYVWVRAGAIFGSGTASGRVCTGALRAGPRAGPRQVFGSAFSQCSQRIAGANTLILDTSRVHVQQQVATGKGGDQGSGSGAFPRRIDHQDPSSRGRAWQAAALQSHTRSGARSLAESRPSRRADRSRRHRRQRLRQ
jgi:hypothetical protein